MMKAKAFFLLLLCLLAMRWQLLAQPMLLPLGGAQFDGWTGLEVQSGMAGLNSPAETVFSKNGVTFREETAR
jgi:hypothetical protein